MYSIEKCLLVSLISLLSCNFVISSKPESIVYTPCETDEDCSHLEDSRCQIPTCVCNGSRFCPIKQTVVVTKIGEKCQKSEECNIAFAECNKFRCECKEGYVNGTDGKRCLIVSEGISGNCEESVQCYKKVPSSVCSNNKCVCDGTHEHKGSCFKTVELGQICDSDAECSANKFSTCKNSLCTCIDGYVASFNGSICLLAAETNNSPCIDDVQCTSTLGNFSRCEDGVCKCKQLYNYKKSFNKCIKDILLGDVCSIHSDCHDPYPEKENRLECIIGVCACRSFLRETNGICIDSSSSRISAVPYLFFIFYILRNLCN